MSQTKDLRASVLAARRAAVPIILIGTPDQWALEARVRGYIPDAPHVSWDCVRGLVGLNEPGRVAVASLGEPKSVPKGLVPCLVLAESKFDRLTCLFIHNAHRFLAAPGQAGAEVAQAISNLRDPFKQVKRTLFLLAPSTESLPIELQPEVVTLEEELPDDAALRQVIHDTYDSVDKPQPSEDVVVRAIDAARGLPAFTADSVYAMSIDADSGTMDLDRAWERKLAMVNRPGTGLKMFRGGPTFDSLGGLDAAKLLATRLFNGPRRPRAIVRVEEIEKTWASALQGGESSGVAAYAFGRILTAMEEEEWDGMIAVGLGGSGKSAFANALASTFGVPRLDMDVGQTRGKYVGESEAGIENLLRVMRHVAGEGAFFVASCNRIAALPPELMRRFKKQPWYFDVPTRAERLSIWPIYLKAYAIDMTAEEADQVARAEGWTGAEIRNACQNAWSLGIPLADAARDYIVPVSRSNPKALSDLRDAARDRFLSASYAGTYSEEKTTAASDVARAQGGKRRRDIGEEK